MKTVLRIEQISLLLPTRQRPEQLKRFYDSAMETSDNPNRLEVVAYVDNDDNSYDGIKLSRLKIVRGERVILSEMWNRCYENAKGDIFGHMGDDIIFRTKGWDTAVRNAINERPGKVCFAWCNDMSPESDRHEFGTHGFVHRNWTTIVGRFVPPYFASDYNDTWFNDVAKALGVNTYLHNYITEHMHHSLGKAEIDQNTRDRLERHARTRPDEIYNSEEKRLEREEEIQKLRQFIDKCSGQS